MEEEEEDENEQPLDLTVKRPESELGPQRPQLRETPGVVENGLKMERSLMTETSELTVSVSVKENGIVHPKKRNWIKMEEEDDSFPHEIEEWKKTFAAGLCGYVFNSSQLPTNSHFTFLFNSTEVSVALTANFRPSRPTSRALRMRQSNDLLWDRLVRVTKGVNPVTRVEMTVGTRLLQRASRLAVARKLNSAAVAASVVVRRV